MSLVEARDLELAERRRLDGRSRNDAPDGDVVLCDACRDGVFGRAAFVGGAANLEGHLVVEGVGGSTSTMWTMSSGKVGLMRSASSANSPLLILLELGAP